MRILHRKYRPPNVYNKVPVRGLGNSGKTYVKNDLWGRAIPDEKL